MRILLDENFSDHRRAGRLRAAGHDVATAGDAGVLSMTDPRVLAWAISEARLVLTMDVEDFSDLHQLILVAGGHHPGILIVRDDGDPRHRMSDPSIIVAIGKLERSVGALADSLHILNHWR